MNLDIFIYDKIPIGWFDFFETNYVSALWYLFGYEQNILAATLLIS